ncbi:MAG: 3-phosphoglycerate dehydrogenase [Candidatus Rokuibacteriota bacterium]|nr:MAG: 3-phosphoglycerate dehydrogenase [Candidatus Rokubacteria bacterium]
MKPLVVIAGAIHPDGMKQLEPEARVIVTDQVTEEGMIEVAREAEGILFRIRPDCTRALMTACSRLKVVGRHGVGLDTVDLRAATDLGIAVVHAPGSNSDSVAEHALMLILACAKQTLDVDRMTRTAEWRRPPKGNMELKGKTLGIVGVGNIGRRMARLGHALGMRVIGYDKYVPDEEVRARGAEPLPDLYSVLSEADVVTCHTPHTPETHHMIDGKAVAKMKDGVIFVNTSRGKTQEEHALFEGLSRGKIRAAGLDVFEEEPVSADNPLLNLPNVVVSSHMAGVTAETGRAMAMQVTAEMLRVLRGEKPHALGNPDLWPKLAHLR